MKNMLLLLLVLCSAGVFAQVPTIQWQKSLGGSSADEAYSIQPTADGGYVVGGFSQSNDGNATANRGSTDYWVVKLNSTGLLQWQKSLGGSGIDFAFSVQQTTDGGYIIAGYSLSDDSEVSGNHGGRDYWVVKMNDTGAIQWQKSLGGSGDEFGYSIRQTTDGGYIVAGCSASGNGDVSGNHGSNDYWVVKLNDTGHIQWQKSFGGSGDDIAESIRQTSEGGYIIAGMSSSFNDDVSGNHGIYDAWIVKINDTGALQWEKSLGGTNQDEAWEIQQTAEGGYIVAGYSMSDDDEVSGNHGSTDCWVIKLNDTGAIQWERSLGGSATDAAWGIQQTADGGYVVAGEAASDDSEVSGNHGGKDYWVVKLNDTGAIQWQKALGGSGTEIARSVLQTQDGGYIVAGYSNSNDGDVTGNHGGYDFWVVKLTCGINAGAISGPAILCSDSSVNLADTATGGMWSMSNGNATIAGGVVTGVTAGADTAVYTITNGCGTAVASFPFHVTDCATEHMQLLLTSPVTVLPNPTTGLIFITGVSNVNIKVYNTLGYLVKEANNTDKITIAGSPAGLYFIQAFNSAGTRIIADKIVKE